MALMTAAEARGYLPNIQGTAIDSELVTLIARFDAVAAQWCGFPDSPGGTVGAVQTLESASYVLYLDGPDPGDSSLLWLGVWPVTAIGSIYSDPIREYGSDTLVASSDYTLFGAQGKTAEGYQSHGNRWILYRSERPETCCRDPGCSLVPIPLCHWAESGVSPWNVNHGTEPWFTGRGKASAGRLCANRWLCWLISTGSLSGWKSSPRVACGCCCVVLLSVSP